MSKAIPKECMALLKQASEMFNETGCVPGFDGEEMPAERIVSEVKEYIAETINDPEALYDPEIWATPEFTLVISWLAQIQLRMSHMLTAPHGIRNNHANQTNKNKKTSLV